MWSRRIAGVFVVAWSLCVVAGCAKAPPPLTGPDARQALADMVRGLNLADKKSALSDFIILNADQFAQEEICCHRNGKCSIWPFSVDLENHTYDVWFGNKWCHFHYTGSFDFQDGTWQASRPFMKSVACGR